MYRAPSGTAYAGKGVGWSNRSTEKPMHVDSTAITDIDYDAERAKLLVRFQSGERYVYVGVPPEVCRSFVEADSKGRFFQSRIRDRYPFNKLDS
jgi:lysyl-tRNA synthetase class 2